jgi:hypothetical protein
MNRIKEEGESRDAHICFSMLDVIHPLQIALDHNENDNVICLHDDLSHGPLEDLREISGRKKWLKEIMPEGHSDFNIDRFLLNIENTHESFRTQLKYIPDGNINIWYAENGTEMTGLLYTLTLLKPRIGDIYTINISKIKKSGKKLRSTLEITNENIPDWMDLREKLNHLHYSSIVNNWFKFTEAKSRLRILKQCDFLDVPIEYFDNFILDRIPASFTRCVTLINELNKHLEEFVDIYYIFWRIRVLALNNQMEFRGDMKTMVSMEIKRN